MERHRIESKSPPEVSLEALVDATAPTPRQDSPYALLSILPSDASKTLRFSRDEIATTPFDRVTHDAGPQERQPGRGGRGPSSPGAPVDGSPIAGDGRTSPGEWIDGAPIGAPIDGSPIAGDGRTSPGERIDGAPIGAPIGAPVGAPVDDGRTLPFVREASAPYALISIRRERVVARPWRPTAPVFVFVACLGAGAFALGLGLATLLLR